MMDNSDKFWLIFWLLFGVTFITFVTTITYYNIATNKQLYDYKLTMMEKHNIPLPVLECSSLDITNAADAGHALICDRIYQNYGKPEQFIKNE